jgi:hypothetical protein
MTEERSEVGTDGYVEMPHGPGLGLLLNQRTIDKYRVTIDKYCATRRAGLDRSLSVLDHW